mmetsp:Transcript_11820/g.18556  ORF Transcript_11820/g.18556 Transcript_11820/m.18556 type:complete len:134 (+) Transcript_11820:137-538(+)
MTNWELYTRDYDEEHLRREVTQSLSLISGRTALNCHAGIVAFGGILLLPELAFPMVCTHLADPPFGTVCSCPRLSFDTVLEPWCRFRYDISNTSDFVKTGELDKNCVRKNTEDLFNWSLPWGYRTRTCRRFPQ